jgi:hypothetical protein
LLRSGDGSSAAILASARRSETIASPKTRSAATASLLQRREALLLASGTTAVLPGVSSRLRLWFWFYSPAYGGSPGER